MFGIILITVAAAMHIYVFMRVASVPIVARRVPRWAIFVMGALMWLTIVLGRELGHGGTSALAGFFEQVGMNWLGVVFIAFVTFLALDIVTGFGLILPRKKLRLRTYALAACLALSGLALFQGFRPPVVEEYNVQLADLPAGLDGTVLVGVSDLHLGQVLGADWLKARVDQIMALKPDMVVLLGDIFEGHGEPAQGLLKAMNRLSAPLGVWAVPGNHEYYAGRGRNLDFGPDSHIQVILDRSQEAAPGLVVAGVGDLTINGRMARTNDPVREALSSRPPGATILLSHSPLRTGQAAELGADLMLSGHTHAGQIWPFGYLVQLRYPYLQGEYQIGPMTLIVCRGTGSWGPRMRLFAPGEILKVTLKSAA